MQEKTIGLRDRKRAETRARMETATVELVLRDGLQKTTIDAICEAANVSPRTFFNYFDSKEDAVLGLPDLDLTDEAALAHSAAAPDGDVVVALLGLLLELATPVIEDTSLSEARAEILQRYPELFSRKVTRLAGMSDDLTGTIHILMSHDPRFSNLAPAESPMAEMILAMCTSAVRTSAKEWVAAGRGAPIDEIRQNAIALVREAVERLR